MAEPLIDIRPDHWAIVADILRRHVPDREVWAFGSRAKWNAKEYSDLDLAVIGETPLSLSVSAVLTDDFAESDLPFKVDVVDWATTSESFRKIIERDKVVVQRAAKQPVDIVAGEWREVAIGELAEIFDGPHATPPKTSNGPVFLGISNLAHGRLDLTNTEHLSGEDYTRWTRRVEPQTGDVIFSYETRLGEAASIPPGLRCCLGRRMGLLRARAGKVDKRFLLYAYLGPQFQETLRSRTIHGSTVDRIPLIDMPSFPLVVPGSINEQKAIAHILGTLDDKIELNRRMSKTLEALARALFKSWFVDFDPVRAKQPKNVGWVSPSGRNPPDKADGGLRDYAANPPYEFPPHIADLFPARLVDSELGEIPEGWRVGRLGDVTGFLGGYAFKSQDWLEHGVPVVKIGSVKPGIVDLSAVSFVSEEVAEVAKRYRLSPGDFLIGMTGYVGEVGLVPLTDNPPLLNQRVGKFVLETAGTSTLAFLYCATRSSKFKDRVEIKSHGTAQANVSAEGILSIPIIVPPKALRDEFNRIGKPILDRILVDHAESRTLAALRDTLLPKLISGVIRVTDAGKTAEAAA